MSILLNLVFLFLGVIALFYGSDWVVSGSGRLARLCNLSPFLIGITVVAVGTSAPELFVSLYSSWNGLNDIVVSNALGSNIVNLGFILGVVLLINPIPANNLGFDLSFLLFTFLLFLLFVNSPNIQYNLEGSLGILEGFVFLVVLIAYFIASYFFSKGQESGFFVEKTKVVVWELIVLILIGLVLLAVGSDLLIRGARSFASDVFRLTDKTIGLTLVATGTSLPEFLTSLIAAAKKELSLSIGNLLGSCAFNISGVLGASAMVNPLLISSGYTLDYWVMVGASVLVALPVLFFKKLGRLSGFLLLATYVFYTLYLVYAIS